MRRGAMAASDLSSLIRSGFVDDSVADPGSVADDVGDPLDMTALGRSAVIKTGNR
jgi:hypothetical protein